MCFMFINILNFQILYVQQANCLLECWIDHARSTVKSDNICTPWSFPTQEANICDPWEGTEFRSDLVSYRA